MTDSPEELSVIEATITYVRDMVAMFRRRGIKSEYAMPDVAALLDVSPKRVKSLYYRDGVWTVPKSEASRIEARFANYLDREIALSLEYTEALRVKKRQLNLVLACKNSSQPCSGYESTGSQLRSVG